MNYENALHYYALRATLPGSTQEAPIRAYPIVQLIRRTKHEVHFQDSHGLKHRIYNCSVHTDQLPRSEETDKFESPILNSAQIITRITHYTQSGSKEYDQVSEVTFNARRREVSFVTMEGQAMKIQHDPVVIDEHFRPNDPSTDYCRFPTFAPVYPLWRIPPDDCL